MNSPNPYLPPADATQTAMSGPRRSITKRVFLGFCVGVCIPAILGGYGMHHFHSYVASLPPGKAVCGYGLGISWVVIHFGAPLGGLVGGLVGLATSEAPDPAR